MINLSKLLFLCCTILLIGACGNDDDVAPTNTNSELQGEWTVLSFNAKTESMTTAAGTTISSSSKFDGRDMDYDLTITEAAYTTSGGYTLDLNVSVDGTPITTSPQTYTDVSGDGTYTVDGTLFTSNGALFDLTVDGVPTAAASGAQSVQYEINADGNLVFRQDETSETTSNGAVVSTSITSTSIWTKK